VYVDHWISEISQTFGDAALDEQDTYLPEALLYRVGTLLAPVSSPTLSLSSQPVLPTTMGAPHAAQHSAPRTASFFRASLRINEFCKNYANGRCRFTAEDCDRIHVIPDCTVPSA
jgi:hypothetical protein